PTKYFWVDMSDLFGEWVPDGWIDRCFAIMALSPQHIHQVLTKRPKRMLQYLTDSGTPDRIAEQADRWVENGSASCCLASVGTGLSSVRG
ncbi:MAG: DUF5131 family protein, partial [Acidimicrobiia bacterium]